MSVFSNTRVSGVAAAILLFSNTAVLANDPIPSSADAFTVYKEVGDWTVYADDKLGTCLIERADGLGNVMQMGLDKKHKHAYVGVFTTDDIKIKNKQKIDIVIDGQVFSGKAHGIKSKKLVGDYSGGYILFNNPETAVAIAEGQELVAFPEKTGGALIVDLTGTKNAMEAAFECNKSISG